MLVMKFGGTSVKDADAIRRLTAIVRRAQTQAPIVVVSALSKVTDQLLTVAGNAVAGDSDAIAASIATLRTRHHEVAGMVRDAARLGELTRALDSDLDELTTLAHALTVMHDASPRLQDAIAAIGELLSSRIVAAALQDAGVPATWVDARAVLVTDTERPASPLMEETRARCRELLLPIVTAGGIPVLGGFIGATIDGVTTTLGRGGSDYSASI